MRLLLLIIILFLVIFIHFVEGARKKPGRKDQARLIEKQLANEMRNPEHETSKSAERKLNSKMGTACKAHGRWGGFMSKTPTGRATYTSSRNFCRSRPTVKTFFKNGRVYLRKQGKLVDSDPRIGPVLRKAERKNRKKRNIRRWETMSYIELTMRRNIRMAFKMKNVFKGRRLRQHIATVVVDLREKLKKQIQRRSDGRRKKRQIAEGIFAGMFILAGLWFGYLALVCFLSIIFPPFIFAMMFTMGFGLIAWFCLKVSDKLLGESEEEEYEARDFEDVNDLEAGYGGGGKKRGNYQLMQSEYDYDQNGGFMPNDPNVYYPNGGGEVHFANQQQLQFNAGGGYGGGGGGYGGDHLHNGYAYSTNRGGNNKRTKLYGGG